MTTNPANPANPANPGHRPTVLLASDLETQDTRRGPLAVLFVQRFYTDAILEAGGMPLIPPPLVDEAGLDQLIGLADALVLPGGGFDIDPALYGEAQLPACGELKPERTTFERALLLRALERNLPVLGICGGMQLMNVVRGGTLWQDLPSQNPSGISHFQHGPKDVPIHDVDVVDGTRLAALVEGARLPVNSTHHQAIKSVGQNLVVSARADDGGVEGIEDPQHPFFVGVQWHPEAMRERAHRRIYQGLIDAARSSLHTAAPRSGRAGSA